MKRWVREKGGTNEPPDSVPERPVSVDIPYAKDMKEATLEARIKKVSEQIYEAANKGFDYAYTDTLDFEVIKLLEDKGYSIFITRGVSPEVKIIWGERNEL